MRVKITLNLKKERKKTKQKRINIYFFFRVKNDFRFDSSFCEEAGSVCERPSPPEELWHCTLSAPTHWFNSASSWACRRNSAPFDNLFRRKICFKNSLSKNVQFL